MYIEEVGASEHIKNVNKVKKTAEKSREPEAPKTDKLDISRSSEFQLSVNKALADTPEIREARIKEIADQIQNNQYQVSSQAIADKIMSNEEYDGLRLELFG